MGDRYFARMCIDYGDGLNTETVLKEYNEKQQLIFKHTISPENSGKSICFEPVNMRTVIRINEFVFYGEDGLKRQLFKDGPDFALMGMKPVGDAHYVCFDDHPQMLFVPAERTRAIYVNMEIVPANGKPSWCLAQVGNDFWELKNECNKLNEKIQNLDQQIENLNNRIQELGNWGLNLDAQIAAFKNSFSWKITAPIRKLTDLTGRYIQKNVKRRSLGSVPERDIFNLFDLDVNEVQRQKEYVFNKNVKFSILVPLYNTQERFLREMIESVQSQTYPNWELCMADGSDQQYDYVQTICEEYSRSDQRILYKKLKENKGISENTNACLDMASGDYISLLDHDDILHPYALFETLHAVLEFGADYVYTDEVVFSDTNFHDLVEVHYKPDFAIDNLRAHNYICHFSSFDKNLLKRAGRFRSSTDGAQDHDLTLRLTEIAGNVYHISQILYYWRAHPQSVTFDIKVKAYAADAAKLAVQEHLDRAGYKAEVTSTKAFPTIFRFKYEIIRHPLVSIIIPGGDHIIDLIKCVQSIVEKSSYDNYEIIIVEDNSRDEIRKYDQIMQEPGKIKVVKYDGSLNRSQTNNFGRECAAGEYLLFLSNSTRVMSNEWIEELLMYAQREDVGAVGAKRCYSDDTVQRAYYVLGLDEKRIAGDPFQYKPKDSLVYMARLHYAQNVSVVSADCLMVSARKYDEAGGMDGTFEDILCDADFCLKLRERGYLNIFNPYAELYCSGQKPNVEHDEGEKNAQFFEGSQQFREKWETVLAGGDPYFSRRYLTKDRDSQ